MTSLVTLKKLWIAPLYCPLNCTVIKIILLWLILQFFCKEIQQFSCVKCYIFLFVNSVAIHISSDASCTYIKENASCIYFKENYETEPFVYRVHNRAHRSLLSQFRCGILPLNIETSWYTHIPLEFRLCILWESNLVEDENHFLFQCHFYHTLQDQFFPKVKDLYQEFDVMNNNLKLKFLMSETLLKHTSEYIYCCYCKRRDFIYK